MVTREERETAIRVYGRRRPGNVTGALDREKDMPNSRVSLPNSKLDPAKNFSVWGGGGGGGGVAEEERNC